MDTVLLVLILTASGPLIGSALGVIRRPNQMVMYNMLSFAAGIMLGISFLELIPQSIANATVIITGLGIAAGTVFMYAVDKIVPHIHPGLCRQEQGCQLKSTAVYLLLGIFIHNFPEGMAIAAGRDQGSVFLIAIAIAIHNIPEGLCTSAPYFHATGKRLKSFLLSASTAIPLVVGYAFARLVFGMVSSTAVSLVIAATAGVMIYIAADELIPISCSRQNGWSHSTIFSLIFGVLLVVLMGGIQ